MKEVIGFDPLLPYPQIALFVVLAIAAAVWMSRMATQGRLQGLLPRTILGGLRVVGVALIVLLLLNPVITQANHQAQKPPLLILFDQSRSMRTADVGGHSRFDAAKEATVQDTDLMSTLTQHYDCRFFGVADTATREDLSSFDRTAKPTGSHTELGESIAAAVASAANDPSGGVLLISDGRNNGDADPVEAARQSKARHFSIFTVCLGSATHGRDVSLLNRRPQVFAAPTQDVPITAEVRSVGYTGQTAMVDLQQGGVTVQTKAITLDDHHPVIPSFTVRQDKEGMYRYTMSVRPMPDEVTDSNNKGNIFLQVLKSKSRVLVLEARPSWDAKFLIQALHTDPSIQVDALFKLTSDKTFALQGASDSATPATPTVQMPKTAADFAKYDIVIIGKGYEDFFDTATTEALKSYVSDHSGNVIFLRGKPGDEPANLPALEPLQWSDDEVDDIRMKVTDEGKRNPAFNFSVGSDPDMVIQQLPNMISATKVQGEKALSVVLARASGVPGSTPDKEMAVLAYQSYGQGKVVSLVGEGLWRWALLPPDLKDYGGCYNDFWTQLVRWMVNESDFLPGQDLTLKTDRSTYSPGETVSLLAFRRGSVKGALPPVHMMLPDGQTTSVEMASGGSLTAFVGSFKVHQAGEYLAQIERPGGQSIMVPFSVFPSQEEDLVTAADPEMMAQIAAAGGGEILNVNELHDLPLKLKQAESSVVTHTQSQSAWDTAPVLALLLGIFCLEWILRRRWGLL